MQAELEKMQQTISLQKNGLPWEGQGPNPMVRIYSTQNLLGPCFVCHSPPTKQGVFSITVPQCGLNLSFQTKLWEINCPHRHAPTFEISSSIGLQ